MGLDLRRFSARGFSFLVRRWGGGEVRVGVVGMMVDVWDMGGFRGKTGVGGEMISV